MREYKANIEHDGLIQTIEFSTDTNPIEYLWGRYGMSSYIESILEVSDTGVLSPARLTGQEKLLDDTDVSS